MTIKINNYKLYEWSGHESLQQQEQQLKILK